MAELQQVLATNSDTLAASVYGRVTPVHIHLDILV